MTNSAEDEFDVIIVGYGPVGAVMAHLLGKCGVRTLVLEREAAAYHLPRAVHFDDEIMRTFQEIGVAEEIEPITYRGSGTHFVDADKKLIMYWPSRDGVGRQDWRSSYVFHQPDLEDILRKHMPKRKSVTVRTRAEAFLVQDEGDHTLVRYEDLTRGKVHRVRAKYVIGCDGGRSLLRRFMETELEDHGFHERWLVVDVILNAPKASLPEYTVQHCNPARPTTYVRCPGNRRRWEITVLPEEDSNRIATPPEVWKLLADWLSPEEAVLERATVYAFHSLTAKQWRKGRLLLAGDAAHQTPPFLGQGMCAGVRDAANLAWKLALVVQGKVGDAILDTYQTERRPNAREYITNAVRIGGLINTKNPEEALQAAFLDADGTVRMDLTPPPIGPGLGKGKHSGQLFGQPRMADGRQMDKAIGYASALLVDAELARQVDLPEDLAVITTEDAPGLASEFELFGIRAALIRPDRYIQGTARTAAEVRTLIIEALPAPVGKKLEMA